ncbi:peptide MFS transporter [Pseudoalteromonas tunicata]|jgi:POT family proton-dependent oligopeptide transporter|uniref:Proton/peptide symporter family protein n=1 Tax=Pseudoalteromonas tunicata D2 TaxID=87626 RepID=A4C5H0_9GAMM|nr:oligopeptide:H+ symporter [Pseudoalteromonas tunicata]ATC96719.1 proton-dependent oligopeptide transporter, POT family [Pseudoalteromonas tunicata]AXT32883.1 MFS transporter [Pseudoalteromonas tunicata]EAR30802.1 proton/peptide symporter family protein [Pseudoalteromonas tunicata D2]
MAVITQQQHAEFLGHPKGLYVCFFTEMWERFSFYGMKALLFLYLVKYHLFTDEHGYNLLGAYGAMVYAIPVIGGLLADRYLGTRKAVIFGATLLVLGHAGMAFEGHQAALVDGNIMRDETALQYFYFSLSLIIMGVGFLKPNISTIVGRLYPENDPRRDSGFTLFYMGINAGAFLAPLICAYLGETYGWKYGFGLAGIGMLAGLVIFITGQKHLQGHGEPPVPAKLKQQVFILSIEQWIYFGAFCGLFVVWGLIQTHSISTQLVSWLPAVSPVIWFLHLTTIILLSGIFWFMAKRCTTVERHQMGALIAFIIAGLLFFSLYEQTYGSWVSLSDRVMDRTLLGVEWTAGQLTAIGAMFILLLSPFFAWLWPFLAKRNLNPSKPLKMALGLLFAGLSFLVLVWATNSPMPNGLISVWYLVLAYLVLEIGELILSPISLAAVTQLSVSKVVSVMMGAWFLGTSYAEILSAELNKLAAIETDAGVITDSAAALAKYQDLFWFSAQIGIGLALVYLLLTPLLKKMMHGVA